jgi:hypothetical protein
VYGPEMSQGGSQQVGEGRKEPIVMLTELQHPRYALPNMERPPATPHHPVKHFPNHSMDRQATSHSRYLPVKTTAVPMTGTAKLGQTAQPLTYYL